MDSYFRKSSKSIKGRSTGFTNLINSKFQLYFFSNHCIFQNQNSFRCVPYYHKQSKRKCNFLRTFWNYYFLVEIYEAWEVTSSLKYVFDIKPQSQGKKMFVLPGFFLVFDIKKYPAYLTDLSQGGPFFWTHPVP